MSVFLAWRNSLHHRFQAVASLTSICAVMLLVYAQLGFYDTCFRSSTLVYDQMDFDLLLVSPHYVQLRFTGRIPRRYLQRAKQVPGIADVTPVYVKNTDFQHSSDASHELLVLAVDPTARPFRFRPLREKLPRLKALDSAIADEVMTGSGMPKLHSGDHVELASQRVRIIDTYQHGAGLIADTVMIVSPQTLARISPGFTNRGVSLGLVQLKEKADADLVLQRLNRLLGSEIRVLRRDDIERNERNFFLRTKPMGIQFGAGVALAFVVSTAVLYQLLAINVLRRSREYATLRAIGYSSTHIYRFVILEALLLELLGLLPATALAFLLYHVVRDATNLPLVMTWQRIGAVVALSLVICLASALSVTRRLLRRDPAELF